MRGGQQVLLAGAQRYRGLHQAGQPVQRILRVAGAVDHRREILGNALVQGGPHQVRLGRKSAVKRSLADAGAARDRLHRRVGAQLRVHLAGRAQDALDVACRVRTQRPVLNRGHEAQRNRQLTANWRGFTVFNCQASAN